MNTSAEAQKIFANLIGKNCCRQCVGNGRSLSIGFGKKESHNKKNTKDSYYGEWEIGTYSSAWRIIKDGEIVCGSLDDADSSDDLDKLFQEIEIGAISEIKTISRHDIQVKLDNNIVIDFFYASSDSDEIFHVSGPNKIYIEYTSKNGWKIGKSNVPWT